MLPDVRPIDMSRVDRDPLRVTGADDEVQFRFVRGAELCPPDRPFSLFAPGGVGPVDVFGVHRDVLGVADFPADEFFFGVSAVQFSPPDRALGGVCPVDVF